MSSFTKNWDQNECSILKLAIHIRWLIYHRYFASPPHVCIVSSGKCACNRYRISSWQTSLPYTLYSFSSPIHIPNGLLKGERVQATARGVSKNKGFGILKSSMLASSFPYYSSTIETPLYTLNGRLVLLKSNERKQRLGWVTIQPVWALLSSTEQIAGGSHQKSANMECVWPA